MDFAKEMLDLEGTNSDNTYLINIGDCPVILTAPHTMEQKKEDGIKFGEFFTKAIAMYVAKKTNCSYLIKQKDTGKDANREVKEDFKDMLITFIKNNNIKLVIDIHGSKKEREYDIEFGTLNNLSCDFSVVKELEDAMHENNIDNITYNDPFKGGAITQTVYEKTNIDIIQLEINQNYRDINDFEKLQNLCQALIDFINQYKGFIKK